MENQCLWYYFRARKKTKINLSSLPNLDLNMFQTELLTASLPPPCSGPQFLMWPPHPLPGLETPVLPSAPAGCCLLAVLQRSSPPPFSCPILLAISSYPETEPTSEVDIQVL